MKSRLCIDIDNVIAQTDEVMRDVIREYTGGWVNFGYDDIQSFNYDECEDGNEHRITPEDWQTVHSLFAERDRILSIKPYPFVQARLRELSDVCTIHLATSRLPKARKATIEWLERNCFDFDYDLHFVQHGEKHSSLGHFAAAVEDDLDQALDFAKSRTRTFLVAHPWNQDVPEPSPDNLRRVAGQDGAHFVTVWNVLRDELLHLARE